MRPLVLIALAACSSPPSAPANDGGVDAQDEASLDASSEAAFVEAPHPLPPPIPTNGGGVLANAQIVVVTFANYTYADDVEAMADWVGTSNWLAAVGGEYGVGQTSVLAKVRIPTSAPAFTKTSDFSQWMISNVGSALPSPPSASTFYAVIFPEGETFTDPDIGVMCSAFTGYHDAIASEYAFAAIGTCPNDQPNLTDLQQVERVFSHELIEALTDPFGTGYAARDPNDPWSSVFGGEVADVCNGYFDEDGFLAVRSWSNAAAAQDRDPCEPLETASAYFSLGVPRTVQHQSAGTTATYTFTAYANAPTSDWTISIAEILSTYVPTVTLAPKTVGNGDTATLEVTLPANASGAATILVHSMHAGDATYALAPTEIVAP